MEYGYIEGYVSSISLVTQTQKTGEKTIETYLINVELPNGLTTNYEETLDFKYELGVNRRYYCKRQTVDRTPV